ncbi:MULTISPECIES: YlxR family protein [Clostridia]|uniref:RNase P modulator RnpM n=1 Tax=Clostridia TaxID=186801 RepID=UPI000EA1DF0E|nr:MULTISPECIES: YlxR family protein [Clostridia]NBJ68358.1 YlxR family protein [Roseburia sp. 1XD42-34]RKI81446.1 YlxR family protein [Clostridium sp. 1xD42-85]
MVKKRKVPTRRCVVTNEMMPKQELIRVVRNKEGEVFVDPTGKKNGRGAYLCKDITVIDQAEKTNALNKHLNATVDAAVFNELRELVAGTTNEK